MEKINYIDVKRYFELLVSLKSDKKKIPFEMAYIFDDLCEILQPVYNKIFNKKNILNKYIQDKEIDEKTAREKFIEYVTQPVDFELDNRLLIDIDIFKRLNLLMTIEELNSYKKFLK